MSNLLQLRYVARFVFAAPLLGIILTVYPSCAHKSHAVDEHGMQNYEETNPGYSRMLHWPHDTQSLPNPYPAPGFELTETNVGQDEIGTRIICEILDHHPDHLAHALGEAEHHNVTDAFFQTAITVALRIALDAKQWSDWSLEMRCVNAAVIVSWSNDPDLVTVYLKTECSVDLHMRGGKPPIWQRGVRHPE